MPWAICFAESTFTNPILAGVELLSPFIDEDTGAHWHPAFIYVVTTGDGCGEEGCCDYPQGHGVSVGGTQKIPEKSSKKSLLVPHPSAPSASQVPSGALQVYEPSPTLRAPEPPSLWARLYQRIPLARAVQCGQED